MNSIRRSGRRVLALGLALLLCLALLPAGAIAADTANKMALVATEGTVTIRDSSANAKTVRKDMRLYTGYVVTTAAKSYAWLALDDSKSVKLDASTSVEVRKNGTALEVLLNYGKILYGSEALNPNESVNIRTANTVCGIRGTDVIAEAKGQFTSLFKFLSGSGDCTVFDQVSGQSSYARLTAGMQGLFMIADPGALQTQQKRTDVRTESFGMDAVEGFALVDLVDDTARAGRIAGATGGVVDPRTVSRANARLRLQQDELDAQLRGQQLDDDADDAEAQRKASDITQPVKPIFGDDPLPGAPTPPLPGGPTPGGSDPAVPAYYTVRFVTYGGSAIPEMSVPDGTLLRTLLHIVPDPKRDGYTFGGWYTDQRLTKAVDLDKTVDADMTLYAKWKLADGYYQITLNEPEHGKLEADKATANYEEIVKLTLRPDEGYLLADEPLSSDPEVTFTKESGDDTGAVYSFEMPASDVTVSAAFKARTFSVTIPGDLEHGSMSANPAQAAPGTVVTLTLTPDDGYTVDVVAYTTQDVGANAGAASFTARPRQGIGDANEGWIVIEPVNGEYSFMMPEAAVTVAATFKPLSAQKYAVSVGTSANGAVEADKTEAAEGDTVTLTVTPDTGYELDALTVTDGSGAAVDVAGPDASGQYTFEMPASAVTVAAAFKEIPAEKYTVTLADATNGTLEADKTEAAEGETVTLTLTPDDGYEVDTVSYTPEGGAATAVTPSGGVYSFGMPAANVTVAATFKPADYTIAVTGFTYIASDLCFVDDGDHLVVASTASAPDGTDTVAYGDTVTLTVTPADGYIVNTVSYTPDGGAATALTASGGAYTFDMPAANVTVAVTFTRVYTIDTSGFTHGELVGVLIDGTDVGSIPDPLTAASGQHIELRYQSYDAAGSEVPALYTITVAVADSTSERSGTIDGGLCTVETSLGFNMPAADVAPAEEMMNRYRIDNSSGSGRAVKVADGSWESEDKDDSYPGDDFVYALPGETVTLECSTNFDDNGVLYAFTNATLDGNQLVLNDCVWSAGTDGADNEISRTCTGEFTVGDLEDSEQLIHLNYFTAYKVTVPAAANGSVYVSAIGTYDDIVMKAPADGETQVVYAESGAVLTIHAEADDTFIVRTVQIYNETVLQESGVYKCETSATDATITARFVPTTCVDMYEILRANSDAVVTVEVNNSTLYSGQAGDEYVSFSANPGDSVKITVTSESAGGPMLQAYQVWYLAHPEDTAVDVGYLDNASGSITFEIPANATEGICIYFE